MHKILFLLLIFLMNACTNTETAGVQIETNTGRKVLGRIVNAEGTPAIGVDVFAVATDFLWGDKFLNEARTDSLGNFTLEFSEDTLGNAIKILALDSFAQGVNRPILESDSLQIFTLQKTQTLQIAFDDLTLGDTLFVEGTLAFALIDSVALNSGFVRLENFIPTENETSKIVVKNNDERKTLAEIPFDFEDEILPIFEMKNNMQNEGDSIQLTLESSPYYFENVNVEGRDFGFSLWLKADSAEQLDEYGRIFEVLGEDNAGFRLQQRGVTGSVNFRINTIVGDYNKLVGTAQILDGEWHQYGAAIKDSTVLIFVDGELIAEETFNLGDGFGAFSAPHLGGKPNIIGTIKDVYITTAKSKEWWDVFYTEKK